MVRRFDLGRALLAIGGALLLASLFVEWYDTGLTGWEAFEALDLVLAAIGLGALYVAAREEVVPEWVAPALGLTTLAVVVVQLVNPPPAATNADPTTGAWLALGAALLLCVGAILSLARFGITVEMREHDPRRRVPAVDRRGNPEGAPPRAAATPADDLGRTETFTALREEDLRTEDLREDEEADRR
jgi:hypothetical protein